MVFIFETGKRTSERECTMEEAIESSRRRVLDGMVDFIILSAKVGGRAVKLGGYYPAINPGKYAMDNPGVECVDVRPFCHNLPKEDYYNEDAWIAAKKSEINNKKKAVCQKEK